MNNTEKQQIRDMINELRQKHKQTQYETELLNQNKSLEHQLKLLKYENSSLYKQLLNQIEQTVKLKHNFETFSKQEAIYLMRRIKEIYKDKELTNEMQVLINRFIFKLTHIII